MAMAGYTKLFSSILASTIWKASDKVRIVWITLLAMADKNGVAEGSIPGLADFAHVTLEDAEEALRLLQQPDKYSRSQEHEGRRIEAVDGGWRIINHAKYRAKITQDERRDYNRRKQAEFRQRQKSVSNSQGMSITVNHNQLPYGVGDGAGVASEGKGEGEEGTGEGVPPEASIPTLAEIQTIGQMIGAPPDLCKEFFDWHEGKNLWFNKHGRLINVQHELAVWRDRDRKVQASKEPKALDYSKGLDYDKSTVKPVDYYAGWGMKRPDEANQPKETQNGSNTGNSTAS
jgi:hypothetical protein